MAIGLINRLIDKFNRYDQNAPKPVDEKKLSRQFAEIAYQHTKQFGVNKTIKVVENVSGTSGRKKAAKLQA